MSGSERRFDPVAAEYERRFVESNQEYYHSFAGLLGKYCSDVPLACEIGVGTGAIPSYWNGQRNGKDDDSLVYVGIDPSPAMVAEAEKQRIGFRLVVERGCLDDAVEVFSRLQPQRRGAMTLITSRAIHEFLLGYNGDKQRVFDGLRRVRREFEPEYVIHGDVDRVDWLSADDARRVEEFQVRTVGHGHDLRKDAFSFDREIVPYMRSEGYHLAGEVRTQIAVPGFGFSPWRFVIGVFSRGR